MTKPTKVTPIPRADQSGKDQSGGSNKPKKGIFWLPNLLTIIALFCGFWSVISAFNGNFLIASIAIIGAIIFDGLDGRVARMTNTASEFGKQFDSMADIISFGVAPALLVYLWSLQNLGDFGIGVAFVYTSCTAIRLAKFNCDYSEDNSYFIGIPSPIAAALIASWIWLLQSIDLTLTNTLTTMITVTLTVGAAILMVSRIRYPSFKNLKARDKVPFIAIPTIAIVIGLITINPPVVIFTISLLYCLQVFIPNSLRNLS